MPLWSEDFALDTESDRMDSGETATKLIQCCPLDAKGLSDVRIWFGWNAWERFFESFEETDYGRHKMRCHCYNLGGYEWIGMVKDVLSEKYVFTEKKALSCGEWSWVADDKTVYKVSVCNSHGTTIEFSDDMRRVGGASMKTIAESVRSQHPNWFEGIEKVKEEADYHPGWLSEEDPAFEDSIHYAEVDAFSQAMIARYLRENGYDRKLTAPSNGLQIGLAIRYRGKTSKECSPKELRWNMDDFRKRYPPLDREMQDIAEKSILGGFVWGEPGIWKGTFCHVDYSSSYPYEYAYGRLFQGRIVRMKPGDAGYDEAMKADGLVRWMLVSFSFSLKEGMLGCIAGRECVTEDDPMTGRMNKKMAKGRVVERLYTETYLEEIGKHYDITDMTIHEMWFARLKIGDFEPMIRELYMKKNRLKEEGKDGTAEYRMTKLFLNGGVHGKTITKTHRRKRIWDPEEMKVRYEEELSDPELCFLIGFTAMMNGRERLLRHCRMLIEKGYRIMMCDTDSIVVNTSPENVRNAIGDWFCQGHEMNTNLGRFDMENDSKGLKKAVASGTLTKEQAEEIGVSESFDEFRCWGLKRYCEVRTTEYGRLFRKSAFAGMHDEAQLELMEVPVEDGFEYEWEQKGKKTGERCAVIVNVTKHMAKEDVWDRGRMEAPKRAERMNGEGMEKAMEIFESAKMRRKEMME